MGFFDLFKKKEVDELGNPIDNSEYGTSQPSVSPFVDLNNVSFRMTIEDVFTITGRGTVVTGVVELGSIKLMDKAVLYRQNGETINTVITGIEMFRKLEDSATVGQNVGLLLRGIERNMVSTGDVIVKPQE